MKNKLTIVKVGGLIINDDSLLSFWKISQKLTEKDNGSRGGNIASNYMRRLGIDQKWLMEEELLI